MKSKILQSTSKVYPSEFSLVKASKMFPDIYDTLPDAIVWTQSGVIQYANSKCVELLRADGREGLIGKSMLDLIDPEFRNIAARRIEDTAKGHPPGFKDMRLMRFDDTKVWVETTGSLIEVEGEAFVQGVFRDISDKKKLEGELIESEIRTRLIADNLPVSIVYADNQRRYRYVNKVYLASYQSKEDEIIGQDILTVMGESAHTLVSGQLDAAYGGEPQTFEAEVPYKVSGKSWVLVNYVPHFDDAGSVVGIYGLVTDITEQKFREQALKASEARLTEIFDIAPEAVITIDEEMCIQLFNKGAERIFGYDADEVIGQRIEFLMPERFRLGHLKHIEGFDQSKNVYRLMDGRDDIAGLSKDGTEFPASASVSKLETSSGKIYTVMLQDVTERRNAEGERLRALVIAEKANQAKSEFLANMSHELRTPLNSILGFSEIIANQSFGAVGNDRYLEYAKDIHGSGAHLLELINDVLDISKIEAGQMFLSSQEVDLIRMIESCLRMIKEQAFRKSIELNTCLDDSSLIMIGDERVLRQVVLNILTNSVKFTPVGGTIEITFASDAEDCAVLQISDTGIGISASDIPKVMEPFEQVTSVDTRDHQGTGLGLPLSKKLTELHGGTFELESELGVGTVIRLTFPAKTKI